MMTQRHDGIDNTPEQDTEDDLALLLTRGVTLHQAPSSSNITTASEDDEDDDEEGLPHPYDSDLQGALGLFAEAAQDMATAGVELGLGRHFACVDFCNQAVEKAAQAISLLRYGRRSSYNHDLSALGTLVGAPLNILEEMARLTPFHPEAFYADTPPEEADEVINAEQASSYVESARKVMRWARGIVLNA